MNILGRLTRDAKVHTLSTQKQVANFSIATNDNYRNKQGERIGQTTYFDCAYWISAKVTEFLTKGTLVELREESIPLDGWEKTENLMQV
jgi:single-strand DNA-binding protein